MHTFSFFHYDFDLIVKDLTLKSVGVFFFQIFQNIYESHHAICLHDANRLLMCE